MRLLQLGKVAEFMWRHHHLHGHAHLRRIAPELVLKRNATMIKL